MERVYIRPQTRLIGCSRLVWVPARLIDSLTTSLMCSLWKGPAAVRCSWVLDFAICSTVCIPFLQPCLQTESPGQRCAQRRSPVLPAAGHLKGHLVVFSWCSHDRWAQALSACCIRCKGPSAFHLLVLTHGRSLLSH